MFAKFIAWVKSLFNKATITKVVSKYEGKLHAAIVNVLDDYWSAADVNGIITALGSKVKAIVPDKYDAFIPIIINLLTDLADKIDYTGNIDDAADFLIEKLKEL